MEGDFRERGKANFSSDAPLPVYVDPNIQGYLEYHDHLSAYNDAMHRAVSSNLNGLFVKNMPGFAITTTGSDGRLEKGPVSLLELLVFTQYYPESNNLKETLGRYFISENPIPLCESIDMKDIAVERMSECVIARPDAISTTLISPNRIFDAGYLYGDEKIYQQTIRSLVVELQSDYGKKVYERIRDKCREHKKITLSGSQRFNARNLTHFDLNAGRLFYNPVENIHSFKQGPLRLVQYSLARDLIKGIRHGKSSDSFAHLPRNTVAKLHALEVENRVRLTHDEVRDITDHYKFFLWFYHRSQEFYRMRGLFEIDFDSREIGERCASIAQICSQPFLKD